MKKISFILLLASALILISNTTPTFATFSDVDVTTDYQTAILWMQNNEVLNGYKENAKDLASFKPNQCINRAEFLKILFSILKINTATAKADLFKDTPENAWYSAYVRTARERKTIEGYPDGNFRPEKCVNRVEAIKMASLEFNNGKLPVIPMEYENLPLDVSEQPWYLSSLNYVLATNTVGLNHTVAYTDPIRYKFFPEEAITRKEVAEMLFRMKTLSDHQLETYEEGLKPYALLQKQADVSLKLDKVTLKSGSTEDTIDFDFYISRTDLGIKQDPKEIGTGGLTTDLVPELNPKLMYMSNIDDTDPDSGTMCDRARYPHRCSVTIKGDELKKSSHEFLIKITFEDDNDSYIAEKITIPHPAGLKSPEIIYPTSTPSQKSTLNLKFKDVGAFSYEVQADLCNEYENNGINPCLDSIYHLLSRKTANGPLTFSQNYPDNPTVKIENGYITVKSNFQLVFEESVNYNITAKSNWTAKDGLKYFLENTVSRYYSRKSGGAY